MLSITHKSTKYFNNFYICLYKFNYKCKGIAIYAQNFCTPKLKFIKNTLFYIAKEKTLL